MQREGIIGLSSLMCQRALNFPWRAGAVSSQKSVRLSPKGFKYLRLALREVENGVMRRVEPVATGEGPLHRKRNPVTEQQTAPFDVGGEWNPHWGSMYTNRAPPGFNNRTHSSIHWKDHFRYSW